MRKYRDIKLNTEMEMEDELDFEDDFDFESKRWYMTGRNLRRR